MKGQKNDLGAKGYSARPFVSNPCRMYIFLIFELYELNPDVGDERRSDRPKA